MNAFVRRNLAVVIAPAVFAALVIVGWELFVNWRDVKPYLLPPPSAVVTTLWEMLLNGTLLQHVRASVTGSCASAFQKLLIQSVFRVAMMSS